MIDSPKRSLYKAISWRIFGVFSLAIVTFLLTKNIKTVTYITGFYHCLQTFFFFIHERIWNPISLGKTKGMVIQLTGLSGAGKTTISEQVASQLRNKGFKVELIDGDNYRKNISQDLGFSKEDRIKNIQRLGFISQVLARNNVIAIIAAINPYEEARAELARLGAKTVYIKCSLSELRRRDTKNLYKRALLEDNDPNKVYNLTGVSDPYEEPRSPDLTIDTGVDFINQSVDKLYKFILSTV